MNTKLKILLRAGVFSLAAVFAFAFTQPVDSLQPEFGQFDGKWYNATGATLGSDYLCNDPEEVPDCTRSDNHPNAPVIKAGEFIPITLSPM